MQNSPTRTVATDIVLNSGVEELIPGFRLSDLTQEQQCQLQRLVEVVHEADEGTTLRRNPHHRVGRLSLKRFNVVVPPPFPPDLFAVFYLYASGAHIPQMLTRRPSPVDAERFTHHDFFLFLLAHLLVDLAGQLAAQRVSRTYEEKNRRIRTIRGRPTWSTDFGHHPIEGITCHYRQLHTDNLLNRLVLAGLMSAAKYLPHTSGHFRLSSQVFVWRSLASEIEPTLTDFAVAHRSLNRLNEHYGPAIALARALTLGFSPDNPFLGSSVPLQSLEFSLPHLFETFVGRMLNRACYELGLHAKLQFTSEKAIVDDLGDKYRKTRPDTVVFDANRPVAVIDAKYKPQYMEPSEEPAARLPSHQRVKSGDLYQIFFYQTQLRDSYDLCALPAGAIVAPSLHSTSVAAQARRTVYWRTRDASNSDYSVRVIPMPMQDVLRALRAGDGEMQALSLAAELLTFLQDL